MSTTGGATMKGKMTILVAIGALTLASGALAAVIDGTWGTTACAARCRRT
jgi:hypothetical protein